MPRAIRIVLAVAVVAILALAVFVFTFDVDRFRPQIEAQISKAFGRDVKTAKLSLRVFPLSIRIDELSIAEDPAFQSSTPFATAKQVFASASLASIMQGSPKIEALQMEQPQVQLIHAANGKWNFASLGGQPGSQTRTGGGSTSFTLSELTMNDGRVTVINPTANVYDHINLKLNDFSPSKSFPISVSAHLPGKDKEVIELKAQAGPINESNPVLTPFDGQVTLQGVSIEDLAALASSKTDISGGVSGKTDIRLNRGELTSSGHFEFDRLRKRDIPILFPVMVDFKLGGNVESQLYQLGMLDVQLDKTHFQTSGVIDAKRVPHTLSLEVKSPSTSIAELARFGGAFGASMGIDASGIASFDVQLQGPFDALEYMGKATLMNATVRLDSLTKPLQIANASLNFQKDAVAVNDLKLTVGATYIHGDIAASNLKAPYLSFKLSADKLDIAELQTLSKPQAKQGKSDQTFETITGNGTLDAGTILASGLQLNQVHAGVALERGLVRLSPVTADLYGGTETGTISADLRPANPALSVQTTLTGVDANRLLSALTATKETLYGNLAARTNLQFSIPPDGNLIKTLNGTLGFNLTNGQLKNVDIISELGKIARFTGAPAPTGNVTPIKRLSGDLAFNNGVANTSNLVAEIPQGSLSTNGSVNLVNQALDMKLVAVLLSGPSKSFGGQLVGGYMSTALANKKGELVIPAIVKGTTAHPSVQPDVAAMAKLKVTELLPSTGSLGSVLTSQGGNTASRVEGVLGALTGQGGAKQQPKSEAGGIIGGFLNSLSKKNTDQKK